MSILTHVFVISIQINYFCNFRYNYLPWHFVKMIDSHINKYKAVCSCICNLYLQLMLIWIKIKMKNTLISSIFISSTFSWSLLSEFSSHKISIGSDSNVHCGMQLCTDINGLVHWVCKEALKHISVDRHS